MKKKNLTETTGFPPEAESGKPVPGESPANEPPAPDSPARAELSGFPESHRPIAPDDPDDPDDPGLPEDPEDDPPDLPPDKSPGEAADDAPPQDPEESAWRILESLDDPGPFEDDLSPPEDDLTDLPDFPPFGGGIPGEPPPAAGKPEARGASGLSGKPARVLPAGTWTRKEGRVLIEELRAMDEVKDLEERIPGNFVGYEHFRTEPSRSDILREMELYGENGEDQEDFPEE
ncbi:MAG: hypothetical protein LBR53_05395 [Deltaproteobacteria bacterium]|jgi:hypothetical protein|nr:hypothetical protein [Deltaproteobacteria bacterium]